MLWYLATPWHPGEAKEVRDGAKGLPLGSSPLALPSRQPSQEGLKPMPILGQTFGNLQATFACPGVLWAPALPLPAPTGVRIWKDVISGALRDACLGLTLIIPS